MTADAARAAAVEQAIRQLRKDGVHGVWIDRAPVFDRTTLLHALYQALQLPAWFGFNWDALEESLFDLDRNDGAPVLLVFHDLELLEERDSQAAKTFLDIVRTVSADPATALQGLVRARDIGTAPPSQRASGQREEG